MHGGGGWEGEEGEGEEGEGKWKMLSPHMHWCAVMKHAGMDVYLVPVGSLVPRLHGREAREGS